MGTVIFSTHEPTELDLYPFVLSDDVYDHLELFNPSNTLLKSIPFCSSFLSPLKNISTFELLVVLKMFPIKLNKLELNFGIVTFLTSVSTNADVKFKSVVSVSLKALLVL